MFKKTVPSKSHTPLFASDVSPKSQVKKSKDTLHKNLNKSEIIRDKVTHDMQPKARKPEPKATGKKKLLS